MDIAAKKQLIVDTIQDVQEEWVIKAIEKILDIEDNTSDSPDWHLPIVMEADAEYKANPASAVKWEDLKKQWDNDL